MPSLKTATAAIALAAAPFLFAAPSAAAKSDFFFHFDDTELKSAHGTKRLYKRLQRVAAERCEEEGEADAEACITEIVDRAVAGIDDERLSSLHERRGYAAR